MPFVSSGECIGYSFGRFFFFSQKTAYELPKCLEFRRVLFRSVDSALFTVRARDQYGNVMRLSPPGGDPSQTLMFGNHADGWNVLCADAVSSPGSHGQSLS